MSARFIAALAAFVLLAAPAMALTISNEDDVEHAVSILTDDDQIEQVLAPGEKLENACAQGCSILMDESEDGFEAKADDNLIIRNGELSK